MPTSTASGASPPSSYTAALLSLLVHGGLPPATLDRSLVAPSSFFSYALIFFKSFPLLLPLLTRINAPHGRFAPPRSLLNLPGNLTWFLMEVWSPIFFILAFLSTDALQTTPYSLAATVPSLRAGSAPPSTITVTSLLSSLLQPSLSKLHELPAANLVLGLLFVTHYVHRAVLQPLRSPPRSPIHASAALSACVFNVLNGFIMGSWIGGRSPTVHLPAVLLSAAPALVANTGAGRAGLGGKIAKGASGGAAGAGGSGGLFAFHKRLGAATATAGVRGVDVSRPGLLPPGWKTLVHPLFLLGVAGWVLGFAGNVWADEVLMKLRTTTSSKAQTAAGSTDSDATNGHSTAAAGGASYAAVAKEGTKAVQEAAATAEATTQPKQQPQPAPRQEERRPKYSIPYGGLYEYISFPNYLCEWIEWFSYALAALPLCRAPLHASPTIPTLPLLVLLLASAPPLIFPVVEVCAMLPRAVNGHRWYRARFQGRPDGRGGVGYPSDRKAVIPFLL